MLNYGGPDVETEKQAEAEDSQAIVKTLVILLDVLLVVIVLALVYEIAVFFQIPCRAHKFCQKLLAKKKEKDDAKEAVELDPGAI